MSAVPTVEEELEAKTLECLSWLIAKKENGDLDGSQFSTGIHCVFACVSGLISSEITEMVTEARADHGDGSTHWIRHLLYKDGDFMVVAWQVGSSKFTFTKHVGRPDEGFIIKEFDEVNQACSAVEKLTKMLEGRGYKWA